MSRVSRIQNPFARATGRGGPAPVKAPNLARPMRRPPGRMAPPVAPGIAAPVGAPARRAAPPMTMPTLAGHPTGPRALPPMKRRMV